MWIMARKGLCRYNQGSWGDCPGLFKWALNAIISFLIRGKQRDISLQKTRQDDHRSRDWSDTATNHGMPAATKIWKKQEMRYPLEPLKRAQPWWHLAFNSVTLILDF